MQRLKAKKECKKEQRPGPKANTWEMQEHAPELRTNSTGVGNWRVFSISAIWSKLPWKAWTAGAREPVTLATRKPVLHTTTKTDNDNDDL